MNEINLSKEAKSLVLDCEIRPGVAYAWHMVLKQHFELYGADRIMTQKIDFDKSYLDIYIDTILNKYDGKLSDVKGDLDKLWNKSKTSYEYFLKTIFIVSKAIDITLTKL